LPERPHKNWYDGLKLILPLVDDPAKADQLHWTAAKLCGWLREHTEYDLSYRTLVRYLHEQGYARRIPRPMPEPTDRKNGSSSVRNAPAGCHSFWPIPQHECFSVTRQALKEIPGHATNGSSVAPAPSKAITEAIRGATLWEQWNLQAANSSV